SNMRKIILCLIITICIITYILETKSLNSFSQIDKLFYKAKDVRFIPDNMVPEEGHLKTTVTFSPLECIIQCLRTSKCAQTNVAKLTDMSWNCDMFGLGTGIKASSQGNHHYSMMFNECEGGFNTTLYSGSAYCFNQGSLNWTDAQSKCLEYGAHLVT
ncbi:unnamed protein product, partial [Owenia fusiformis]